MAYRWNLKITFMEITRKLLQLDKRSLLQWKIMNVSTSFICVIILFNRPLEYDDCTIFKLLMWMQNLNQSTLDRDILYAGR
jgi:hypothetical protein